MQTFKFSKMHGAGNDYIYVNCFKEKVENINETAKAVSDRHFGIGSDGLVLICPSDVADFRMDMYNSDGSQEVFAQKDVLEQARIDQPYLTKLCQQLGYKNLYFSLKD